MRINRLLFVFPLVLVCCTARLSWGADQGEKIGKSLDNDDLNTLLESNNDNENLDSIPVDTVYVPYPPGWHGIVGQYECPLSFKDKDNLRRLTVSYFEENKLSVLFDKGSESLAVVIALKETEKSSEFVAYKARFDLEIFPKRPTQGPIDCDILFSVHRITGSIRDGKRDLSSATYSDDDITQGLMAKVRAFASNAEKRPPRPNLKSPFQNLFSR